MGGALRITKDKTKNKLVSKGAMAKLRPNVPMFGGNDANPAQAGQSFAASMSNMNAGLVSTVALSHTQGIELINPDLLLK